MSSNFNGLCILCLKPMVCSSRWANKNRPNQEREFQIQYTCQDCKTCFIRILTITEMDNDIMRLEVNMKYDSEEWIIFRNDVTEDIFDEECMS